MRTSDTPKTLSDPESQIPSLSISPGGFIAPESEWYPLFLLRLALSDGTFTDALAIAAVVGSILTIINQGDAILHGNYPPLYKVLLTYLVPYSVSTYSAVRAKLRMRERDQSVSLSQRPFRL
jgi:hypothetical protein